MTPGRRNLIILGGVIGIVYGLRAVPWESLPGLGPDYVAIDGLSPFRTVASDAPVSSAAVAFIGIDPPGADASARQTPAEAVKADLCSALFGTNTPPDVISIAYFGEIRCPFCRTLESDLDDLLAANPDTLRLVQHELPIFGPSSELAARASIAAERQGKRRILHQRLLQTAVVVDERSVLTIAASVGLDADRLAHDMRAPDVQVELDQSRALADVFGFFGTPGLVIGRTVMMGAVPPARLRQVVADELALGPLQC